jgi:DNA-binding NtrC family response regulator
MNMSQGTRDGKFREDLFYRLNTVPISVPPLRDRKDDIALLFRKFASDFADKYRMPPVRLTEDAKRLLMSYYWNGNIRQLKNITEQISVIEQQREINAQILRTYLPENELERMPALFSRQGSESKSFNSEREILYQVLFDMKKDMNDLKKVVHDMMSGQKPVATPAETQFSGSFLAHADTFKPSTPVDIFAEKLPRENTNYNAQVENTDDFEVAEEYQEVESTPQPQTLEDMERQMIKQTLDKYRGKRKAAAEELKISERTLYRKIKEYGIE